MNIENQAGVIESAKKIKGNFRDYEIKNLNNGNGSVKREPPNIKVLMYHRVVRDKRLADSNIFCVHVDKFRKQIEILIHLGFTPITFNDYRLFVQGELQLPKKPVILTFDDGYLDTYEIACPELIKYGMRAVIFVLGNRTIKTNVWDQESKTIPEAQLMEDWHIIDLHSKGFEIGAHTLNHVDLQQLSIEEAFDEIKESRLAIETLIRSPVRTFCYPFGSVNADIKKYTRESGFDCACGVYTGPPRFEDDLFEIRRTIVQNTTSYLGFVTRLITPFEYMKWLWWRGKEFRNHNIAF